MSMGSYVILKKKDDDYDITTQNDTATNKKYDTKSDKNNNNNNNHHHNNNVIEIEDDSKLNKIKSYTLKDCFSFDISILKQPSNFYIYYTRFSMYFIFLVLILALPKKVVPEISDLYTLQFWIPSTLSIRNSIIGFIIAIIFGQPWLDNPIIQIHSLNKFIYNAQESCPCCKVVQKPMLLKETSTPKSTSHSHPTCKISSKRKNNEIKDRNHHSSEPSIGDSTWNPEQHFNNKMNAFLVDVTRLLCSCFIIPVIEELMFRYIFYRFFIGGFKYKFVSFSTWKWTAAILSNIALTHFFYIRCYGKGEEWISGLINGYLCTFSMVKQGQWNASVTTHSLINFYIGVFVLVTKKYKYWY